MKIRKGLVSNSSSSSFTCEVCGREDGGFDVGIDDVEMCECTRGHIFCQEEKLPITNRTAVHIVANGIRNGWIKDEETIKAHDEGKINKAYVRDHIPMEEIYDVDPLQCPLCCMNEVSPIEATDYLLKKNSVTMKDVKSEILATFSTYDDFRGYLEP